MKLNSTQVKQTLSQMNAHVLPDSHPAVTQLTSVFGDHTFFLGQDGLNVVETGERAGDGGLANVVNLANWADKERTALAPHKPEVTDVVVEIGPEEPDATD